MAAWYAGARDWALNVFLAYTYKPLYLPTSLSFHRLDSVCIYVSHFPHVALIRLIVPIHIYFVRKIMLHMLVHTIYNIISHPISYIHFPQTQQYLYYTFIVCTMYVVHIHIFISNLELLYFSVMKIFFCILCFDSMSGPNC